MKIEMSVDDIIDTASTGDVVMMGGRPLGKPVEFFTMSSVSHCAPVVMIDDLPWLPESTGRGMRLHTFEATVDPWPYRWLLKLRAPGRVPRVEEATALARQVCAANVPYDYAALVSFLVGRRPPSDYTKMFCSEWTARFLKVLGSLPSGQTTSVSPVELARWALWYDDYYDFSPSGPAPELVGFNRRDPAAPMPDSTGVWDRRLRALEGYRLVLDEGPGTR